MYAVSWLHARGLVLCTQHSEGMILHYIQIHTMWEGIPPFPIDEKNRTAIVLVPKLTKHIQYVTGPSSAWWHSRHTHSWMEGVPHGDHLGSLPPTTRILALTLLCSYYRVFLLLLFTRVVGGSGRVNSSIASFPSHSTWWIQWFLSSS